MHRFKPSALAGCALILAISISAIGASTAFAEGRYTIFTKGTKYVVMPPSNVCVGNHLMVTIQVPTQKQLFNSKKIPRGTLKISMTATHGKIVQQSNEAIFGSLIQFEYTALSEGEDVLKTVVSLVNGASTTVIDTAPSGQFTVVKCIYKLDINAKAPVDNTKFIEEAWFNAKGCFYVDTDNQISGKIKTFANFSARGSTSAYVCNMAPQPSAASNLTISGSKENRFGGLGDPKFNLVFEFKTLEKFPAATITCVSADNKVKATYQFPAIPSWDPDPDLKNRPKSIVLNTIEEGLFKEKFIANYGVTQVTDPTECGTD
jgi:hypothetical protein